MGCSSVMLLFILFGMVYFLLCWSPSPCLSYCSHRGLILSYTVHVQVVTFQLDYTPNSITASAFPEFPNKPLFVFFLAMRYNTRIKQKLRRIVDLDNLFGQYSIETLKLDLK